MQDEPIAPMEEPMTSTRLAVAALTLSLMTALLAAALLLRPTPPDPFPQLTSMQGQINDLSAAISTLSDDVQRLGDAIPEPVDLSAISTRLDGLAQNVDDVRTDVAAACAAIAVLAVPASPVPSATPAPTVPVC